jgi:hypothetical protein
MALHWKTVHKSVAGTSHEVLATPCQDFHQVVELVSPSGESCLIVACSDGAGSATHSHIGSQSTCGSFVELATSLCSGCSQLSGFGLDMAKEWINRIRERLQIEADNQSVTLRDLACTLLGAIVCGDTSLFFQIGDGAIVTAIDEQYSHVFWPQSGEYANTTNFITDRNSPEALEFRVSKERFSRLAVFTDGLERLILRFSDRTVHGPFLSPFFNTMTEAADSAALFDPLHAFLTSASVNSRTDDDKTLILCLNTAVD